ncbi:hypothetical protein I3760_01G263200 [Carya illinoinensis]|nr:hypothetical protein I3760_01G263200 [Carya illinoinensis]
METEEVKKALDVSYWKSGVAYDQWIALPVSGRRPPARYKHAAAAVDEKLYVVGGSRNGRLAWSNLKLKLQNADEFEERRLLGNLPATSGHNLIKWGNRLLLIGGHSKKVSDKITGSLRGNSATLVGSRVIVFGGEDKSRRLLNDVHVLDLETMTWDLLEATQTPPTPRFDHTAAVHAERYLLVFGSCSHSIFFNDLHVLDLQTSEKLHHTCRWNGPSIIVTARAGHAGINIDENWYIVGGGDNKNGCPETLVLNMSKLVWSALTTGLSVCSALIDGEKYLVAFGGYNGKYSNEVYVMKPKPRDSSRPKIFQSPAAASVTAAYALTKAEKLNFTKAEDSNSKEAENSFSEQDVTNEIKAIREEKDVLELSLAEVRAENTRLRGQIGEKNGTHSELSKELLSVQGQLIAERSRCFKLEVSYSFIPLFLYFFNRYIRKFGLLPIF